MKCEWIIGMLVRIMERIVVVFMFLGILSLLVLINVYLMDFSEILSY